MTEVAFDTIKAEANKRHKHARSCDKSPDVCKACKDNRAYFDSLPLDTLARVLADTGQASA